MAELILFEAHELLPEAWRRWPALGPVRVFNPALLWNSPGWIFAFRAVGPDGSRRIGICRLDSSFRIVTGSQAALSEKIAAGAGAAFPAEIAARNWFADPRLYRLAGRLFICWNTGWHEPGNHQYVQELHPDTLEPMGLPRELALARRCPLEKNWMLFGEGPVRAVYRPSPHTVLSAPLLSGEGPVVCTQESSVPWDVSSHEASLGELRGGAPPQLVAGQYYSICHSVRGTPGDYRYVAAVYRFAAQPPFRPTAGPAGLLPLPDPFEGRRTHPKLNPAVGSVVYPCGAVHRDGRWHVSYGLHDEHCAIAVLPHAAVEAVVRS